ncbi:Canalicular multispecific organic anion transporter 2 [Phytophthora citrophthora]|uniref:Canalicular multispecific organic anion transporter 2 n=1 Tax=Phytophthora citrophthora TaxID=4793 RepID=A0AAD9LJY4_9STRA|nr:Canalicular multispecific organic anion transporter 2 [Phytophthora citrophthora]
MVKTDYVKAPPTPDSVSKVSTTKPETVPFSLQPNPLASASFLSILIAQWVYPMISLGSKKILEMEDMWPLCTRDSCEAVEARFRCVYAPNKPHVFGISPVAMAFAVAFRTELTVVFTSCMVYVVALGTQSYVAQGLLEFLNNEENIFHISSGYWLMAMMTGSSLVAVLSLNYVFFVAARIGVNMRSLTMSLIYDKSLKLSSEARQEYTTGEILTLMSVDTERVFNFVAHGPWLVMGPLGFVISIMLVGVLFDFYSSIAGAVVLITVMALSVQQSDRIAKLQKQLLKVIDERVKVTSEALQGIRVMKFYAWEDSLAKRVDKLRLREVKLLRKFHLYQVVNTVMLFVTPTYLSGVTLGLYMLIRNHITVVQAFTLIAMVNICRTALNQLPQAIGGYSKAKISFSRIDRFLIADAIVNPTFQLPSTLVHHENASNRKGCISIRDASFSWPDVSSTGEVVVVTATMDGHVSENEELAKSAILPGTKGFQLEGINLEIERGTLVMIVGRVGAGKSSLVNAILGEMPRTSGVLDIGGRIAYVSQDTWIRNATLRDNILFEQEYDAERYAQVLDASQLTMDLKALPNGDSTEIGERGINLSGGQKARVAIARAMYRTETDVLILDDPLSAVDPHVAHAIFDKCVAGLAREQTRLLVLNSHYDLLPSADHIIVMNDGVIIATGSYADVVAQVPHLGLYGSDFTDKGSMISRQADTEQHVGQEEPVEVARSEADVEKDAAAGQLVQSEDRVRGTVSTRVYKTYFDESGFNGIVVFVVLVLVYCIAQTNRTVVDWWPGHWARTLNRHVQDLTNSSTDLGMWYLGLIILCSILTMVRALMMIETCVRTSQNLHDELFRRVLNAPITRYFDVTPMGRILNRFSNDLDQMDSILPQEYQILFQNVSMALGSLVVSAFASYWIGVSYIPIFFVFLWTGEHFKKTSCEIKRLEGVTRTPVYNLFSETLSGLSTIRAFRMENTFATLNREVVDTNTNLYLTYWCSSRWLATRLDLLSVTIIFIVTLYLVSTKGQVGVMTSGISLTYSLMLTSVVQWVMRAVDRTDNAMTSVERLLFFRQIESEVTTGKTVKDLLDDKHPESEIHTWPSRGSIQFDQLCLRYRPELPLVLKGVNLEVAAGEKIGICGRTGAGKSSLMIALFRICDFDSGRVLIDDVDIATINLRELRRSLAIIPQDPVLFSGPLRENLDPFHEYSDERIWHVLKQVHMADSLRRWGAGLDFEVAEGGDNLSVGQRQLICIGRALLKDSKVVVLDEATANVDTATDALIQTTIQETFEDKTVLIIAHRINTIMHCDKIAVMDAGRVAEFDSPSTLLARPTSVFAALAKRSGAA